MKKLIIAICLVIFALGSFAQNSILIRHDTSLLKAEECEWIIKSLIKNNPALTSEIGKLVPLIILEAIEKGKLKAFDPETNKPIPAKEIFTWKVAADTVPEYDDNLNISKYRIVKRLFNGSEFNEIRVYQDWYFDITNGKFYTTLKCIELIQDISSPQTDMLMGQASFCKIYY